MDQEFGGDDSGNPIPSQTGSKKQSVEGLSKSRNERMFIEIFGTSNIFLNYKIKIKT